MFVKTIHLLTKQYVQFQVITPEVEKIVAESGIREGMVTVLTKHTTTGITVNEALERHCNRTKIPVISVHGLRHTHASVLLFAGVSIASVARRLGHSSMTTTQKTYLHIIRELDNQDIDLVMRSLSGLS